MDRATTYREWLEKNPEYAEEMEWLLQNRDIFIDDDANVEWAPPILVATDVTIRFVPQSEPLVTIG